MPKVLLFPTDKLSPRQNLSLQGSHSKTLLDNISSHFISHEIIYISIAATISDHLHQFLWVSNILSNRLLRKNLILMKKIGQNLNKEALHLTMLAKIRLTHYKIINKMWIFSMDSFFKQYELGFEYICSIKKS